MRCHKVNIFFGTGISAADRAKTVLDAVAPNAKSTDIVQPGHIFPLMAQPGGVLIRPGHTEAGCDLARLAGLEPASVIVEILNDDGSMARRDDLGLFAEKHGIKWGTIEDLISYRVENEKTIERIDERPFNTKYGEWTLVSFLDSIHQQTHTALVKEIKSSIVPHLISCFSANNPKSSRRASAYGECVCRYITRKRQIFAC
jgi:3,4-dihydroxy 2-butanone 4-phosphate synthase/GTP cyclohydrolase II